VTATTHGFRSPLGWRHDKLPPRGLRAGVSASYRRRNGSAYRRSDALAKRRLLLCEWAAFYKAKRLIGEALSVPQDEKPDANDRAVVGSSFEGVATLAGHSLSQAVRRIVADTEGLAEFTPMIAAGRGRLSHRWPACQSTSQRRC
jgi:hypothetical protein